MPKLPLVLLALFALAGACAQRDAAVAEDGRQRLVGLRSDDLRLCAGVPDRTATSDGGDFWTYDRAPPPAGLSVPVPVTGGAVNLTGASACRVTFQLVEGRVTRIGFSSASDLPLARDSACAPVIQGCLRLLNEGSIRTR
ncbi:MAG TPA: hypothetical protein VD970_02400 [Acetobacteraceae bacterium]|nr:hypothetical protein [Acetobacteraceae bacterium]